MVIKDKVKKLKEDYCVLADRAVVIVEMMARKILEEHPEYSEFVMARRKKHCNYR